ncbi:MAG: hypothetical protein JWM19_2595 [Actinomycetia bacterium]|nr:hypothetical protein [Actinomycetes bacterium]
MDAWEWTAGSWTGITDHEERALERAAGRLDVGETARVEKAISSCGALYRLGVGWTATRAEADSIDWQPLGSAVVAS